jgi:S-adenosylmethionine:tRNA ribosyltransferase-isomerase
MAITVTTPSGEHTSIIESREAVERARAFLSRFTLPRELEATAPPEAFGRSRDEVRLEVASTDNGITHTVFNRLPDFLKAGDVLVVNDSATMPAALSGYSRGQEIRLHVSTPVSGTRRRLVELRHPEGVASRRYMDAQGGDVVLLPDGGSAELIGPLFENQSQPRLWNAALSLPQPLMPYLHRWGQPIRYSYVTQPWALGFYQTIFGTRPGSSEMPSAGRPFSRQMVRTLLAKGIKICPITLHTGVASLESHEPPYPEPYVVPTATADAINAARGSGGRVIAVGTTAVRALETVCDADGSVAAQRGFTDLVVTQERGVRAVDGLVTGWHEPQASHLMMIEAIAGASLLAASYEEAVDQAYLWHEFGDSHLILR